MKQVVVVGIDFSEAARAACSAACDLARATGSCIQLVHVADSERRPGPDSATVREWLADDAAEDVEIHCREGTPWVELLRHAEAENARFIVVGSHGASGFQPLAPGSTTARLLTRSTIPVLVVPGRA